MTWRDRLSLLAVNAKLMFRLRGTYHKEETLEFARYLDKDSENCSKSASPQSDHYESRWTQCQDDLVLAEAEVVGDPRDTITEWQAGWNVTNAIQGMFIVSFPYTVVQGGYWALGFMVLMAWVCCHTGNILVDCLYDFDSMGHKVRVRSSYVDIAAAVWGPRLGARVVHCAQLIELLMTCILYVLLCGDLIQGSFPSSLSLTSWILVVTSPLLACAFLTSLARVSTFSMWCTVAHILINAIILIYCFTQAGSWHWRDTQVRIDIWTFPISMGIIVFSYTSQIFLPSLEGKLRDRGKFRCMMTWTHVTAAFFKALFSYVGFLTWGFSTLEVITNNLPSPSLKLVINLILVCKALLSYPLPYYASVELIETALFKGAPATWFPSCLDSGRRLTWWALTLRLGLVLFTSAMAVGVPHFALLMGLVGSVTGTLLSLVWPCYFHLRLRWAAMSRFSRLCDFTIIVLGVFCGIIGVYYSAHALSRAYRGLPPQPIHSLKLPLGQ